MARPRLVATLHDTEARELREKCTRFVAGHGLQTAETMLADVPADTDVDRYGDGGVVAALERKVADLLGKPAAVFLPSGTMAQQVTLRVHADRRGRRTVVSHPTSHLLLHEDNAMQRVQDLVGRPVGSSERLLTLDDLTGVAEPVAALLIELPQREIGGQLPTLQDLAAQLDWARARGAATHLDGARLWEAAAGYGRPTAEIAALFDTVYVSFYKGIGALPGCCVAGEPDVVGEVREWRKRMGGTLYGMWPNAASAVTCLDRRLPRMTSYVDTARELAAALGGHAGIRVVPDPPQTNMMHLLLDVTAEDFVANAKRLAAEQRVWSWPKAMPTLEPSVQRVELSVGDATLEWDVKDLAESIGCLVT